MNKINILTFFILLQIPTFWSILIDSTENQDNSSSTDHFNDVADESSSSCILKRFGEGKFVCVCNSTYCDELGPIHLSPVGTYKIYTSTRDGQRLNVSKGNFEKFSSLDDIQRHIYIQRTNKLQFILGFGGAFTDAAGINIKSLPEAAQAKLIGSYFGKRGIGYSLCRVPMGGTDFSTRNYTYNDHPGDVNLTNFQLAIEDFMFKIPLIKKAMSISPNQIRLVGSPWSSPPWTKTNGDYKGLGWLKREYWTYWAKYFVKFLISYKENEVDFWAVTTQNEPSTGLMPRYPFNTLGWRPEWMLDWIVSDLGPILKDSFPKMKILILDDNTVIMKQWTDTILSNKTALNYISGVGFHWYSNRLTGYGPIKDTSKKYPQVFLLATEACNGFLPWESPKVIPGSWERAESYAEDIIRGLDSGSGGWIDWNLALNLKGGENWAGLAADSAILVNATSGEFYKQPTFYALAHLSKFFQVDSRLVQSVIKIGGFTVGLCRDCVRTAAVQNPDGSVAVFILNRSNVDVQAVLEDPVRGFMTLILERRSMKTLIYQ